jgi:tetratricopeptide (TPR) repeat protein
MTSVSNHAVEIYIQRVTELSQSVRRIPTSEELEKLAVELGISNEEIEAAQKQSQDHLIRAKSYLSLKHWDDAIAELQEALVFNPSNLEILTSLATAYLGRWYKHHRLEDEQNIRDTIRQCFAIKPDHEESLNILATLDREIEQRQRNRAIVGVGLGIVFASLGVFLAFNDSLLNLLANKPSKLQELEFQLREEIQSLRQEQEQIRTELLSVQQQEDWQNKMRIAELEERLTRLTQNYNRLQRRSLQLEQNREESDSPPKNKPNGQSDKNDRDFNSF